jgi:hypothetical protein
MAVFTTSAGTYTWDLKLTNTDAWVELFPSKKNLASKPIPFAFAAGSSEITQFLGQDSPKQKFTIQAHDDTSAAAIEAAWLLMLPGTLNLQTEFGAVAIFIFTNVYLTDVSAKRRRPWEAEWEIDVEFRQYT